MQPVRMLHAPLLPAADYRALVAITTIAVATIAVAACVPPAPPALHFTTAPEPNLEMVAARQSTVSSAVELPGQQDRPTYLAQMREEYALDAMVGDAVSDLDRVRRLSRWVRQRWEHNGDNVPLRPDPLSILAEARSGRRFRCVEYAEVLAGALSAVGVPARVVGLQRADAETAESGAGHVVAEAYLRDARRWVLVDGQWDVIPFRGAEPLDAVGLQRALAERAEDLRVESLSGTTTRQYARWIAVYLFFFVAEARPWTTAGPAGQVNVVLVPLGYHAPRVFQRRFPVAPYRATHSLATFYAAPGDSAAAAR